MIKVIDKSKNGIYNSNMELVDSFSDYSSKNLDFDKPVTIEFLDDEENAKNPLGTTAHYSPDQLKITIYVTGRHIKDILRSASHELIHHVQNCRGDLSGMQDTSLGYAQRDKHMRDMETEAFNSGNIMYFRDFEDNYKQGNHKMSKLRESRLKKLSSILTDGSSLLVEQDKDELRQRDGEYKGVRFRKIPGTRSPGSVGLRRYTVIKIADCRSPKSVGAYIKSQVESSYVNDNELLLLTLGLESCKKRKKLLGVVNHLNLDDTGPLYRYIKKISMATNPGLNRRIFSALRDSAKGSTPEAPAEPGMTAQDAAMSVSSSKFGTTPVPDQKAVATGRGPSGARTAMNSKCDPFKKPFLRAGCVGNEVTEIQNQLYKLLGLKSDIKKFVDGKFGGGTKKAVQMFQKKFKLKPDGVVGPTTARTLSREFDKIAGGAGGSATIKGPAAGLNPEKLGMEVDNIFKQVVTDYPLVPQNERDPEYRRVRRQVMNNIRTELGTDDDKRREYATGDGKISRLKMAQKIRSFITQAMRG
jgi:peptidoglycan hydrolase-like protein with peptidoglycan-binding domain